MHKKELRRKGNENNGGSGRFQFFDLVLFCSAKPFLPPGLVFLSLLSRSPADKPFVVSVLRLGSFLFDETFLPLIFLDNSRPPQS